MQIIIGSKDGKSFSVELDNTNPLNGKRIGDTFEGSILGLEGYSLKITGGSDNEGFPMKKNLHGTARRKILAKGGGTGIRNLSDGERRRKSMRGNAVADDIAQLNTKVVEEGSKGIEELLNSDEEEEEEN